MYRSTIVTNSIKTLKMVRIKKKKKKTLRKKEVPQKGHRILVPPSAASSTLKIEPLGKGALSSDRSSLPPHEGRGPESLPYSPQVAWVYEEGPLLLAAAVNLGLPAVTRAFSLGTPQNLQILMGETLYRWAEGPFFN